MNLGKTIGQLCSFLENKGLFQPRFLGGRGLKNEFSEPDVIKEQKSTGHTKMSQGFQVSLLWSQLPIDF